MSLLALSVAVGDLKAARAGLQVDFVFSAVATGGHHTLVIELSHLAAFVCMLEPKNVPLQGIDQAGMRRKGQFVELILPEDLSQSGSLLVLS